jgi:hypothetical protein
MEVFLVILLAWAFYKIDALEKEVSAIKEIQANNPGLEDDSDLENDRRP